MADLVIRTSASGWFKTLAIAYRDRTPVLLIDDAGIGIDPDSQTLFDMAKKARLSKRELAGVCTALGMSVVGIVMIGLAFVDPEPTSKLGLLVGGGVICVLGGGYSAIHILTKQRPPTIEITKDGVKIHWE